MRWPVALLTLAVAPAAFAADAPGKGVELADLDRKADPCVDFYEFANGSWRAQNPIPAWRDRWSRRWAAGEAAKDRLKVILDEASSRSGAAAGSPEQLIGDYYAACMDEATVNGLGTKPVEPLLLEIDALVDTKGVQAMIARFHDMAITVPFRVSSTPDYHEPSQVIADVAADGLGLPDRDYYLKTEARFQEARDKYLVHVANTFRLAGASDAPSRAAADTVLRFETRLAEASLDRVARRDPHNSDHKTSFAGLQRITPHFDWAAYLDAVKLPRADLNVEEPRFLEEVDRRLKDGSIADWKTYLKWHLLRSASPFLSAPFVAESFDFEERYLGGVQEMAPRWKRCVETNDQLLGEALGRKYVEKHFPPAAKLRMQELVRNLLLAMGDVIRGLAWMSDETKAKALHKLSTFNPKIGYPDTWKDYATVRIRRDALWADALSARRFNVEDDRRQVGKPVDRGRWGMTPPTSNAYYSPLRNEIVFPAGILQPPAFSMDATDAVNYGAIGVVIGHEISHGFDDQGAQFDADGRLSNWWTPADLEKFKERGQCVVDQFDGYFVEPGLHHNGKLVLGESIGDLAGAKIALLALRKAQAGRAPAAPIDGFDAEQQFFVAWGQFRGDAIRPETERLMMQVDPHPTGRYRVIGPLSNMPEFQKAFRCPADSPMVRPPARRCEVW